MALIDEMKVHMRAGRGGNGVVRWLHEKFKEFGGPSGGDGGNGGNIYVRGVRDTLILAKYKNIKEFKAENGEPGGNNSKHGANGKDFYLDLPVGSIITNKSTGEVFRLEEEGEEIMILKGGHGGMGNERFKSSVNQKPEQWTAGRNGAEADFYIEVELIASAGLIGLPNAGKSSLLNALTEAHAKIGAYQFTTLEPNLGSLFGYVLADIPGLIEGASEGKGLGHKFLRHVRRTRVLVHCISLENESLVDTYNVVRNELEQFDPELSAKKEIILLTKHDIMLPAEAAKKVKEAMKIKEWKGKTIMSVSSFDLDSLKVLTDTLIKMLKEEDRIAKELKEKKEEQVPLIARISKPLKKEAKPAKAKKVERMSYANSAKKMAQASEEIRARRELKKEKKAAKKTVRDKQKAEAAKSAKASKTAKAKKAEKEAAKPKRKGAAGGPKIKKANKQPYKK